MLDKNFFRVYTVHKTEVILDANRRIIHRAVEQSAADHLPLYASIEDDGITMFFIDGNRVRYIQQLTNSTNFVSGDQPVVFGTVKNDDGSIAITINNKFLSARKDSGQFDLRGKNQGWEHFFLEPVSIIEQSNLNEPSPAPYKISIVIPALNISNAIEPTLNSVINQSLTDYEVIIVEALRAEPQPISDHLKTTLGNKLAIIQADAGAKTRGDLYNIGISFATGQYVLLVEGGDILTPSALNDLYSIAIDKHADAVYLAPVDAPTALTNDMAERVHAFVDGVLGSTAHVRFLNRKFLTINRLEIARLSAAAEPAFSFALACRAGNYFLAPDRLIKISAETVERPPEQNFFLVLNEVFEELDKFMNRLDFFIQHLEFKFIVFKYFDEYCQPFLKRDGMTPYEFYQSTLKIVRDNRAELNRTAFLAYNFNSANYQYAQLLKKDRRIRELNEEIKKIKAERGA